MGTTGMTDNQGTITQTEVDNHHHSMVEQETVADAERRLADLIRCESDLELAELAFSIGQAKPQWSSLGSQSQAMIDAGAAIGQQRQKSQLTSAIYTVLETHFKRAVQWHINEKGSFEAGYKDFIDCTSRFDEDVSEQLGFQIINCVDDVRAHFELEGRFHGELANLFESVGYCGGFSISVENAEYGTCESYRGTERFYGLSLWREWYQTPLDKVQGVHGVLQSKRIEWALKWDAVAGLGL